MADEVTYRRPLLITGCLVVIVAAFFAGYALNRTLVKRDPDRSQRTVGADGGRSSTTATTKPTTTTKRSSTTTTKAKPRRTTTTAKTKPKTKTKPKAKTKTKPKAKTTTTRGRSTSPPVTRLAGQPKGGLPRAVVPIKGARVTGVYLAAFSYLIDAKLPAAKRAAVALGYRPSVKNINCDQGAREALRLNPRRAYGVVSVYFRSASDASRFVKGWRIKGVRTVPVVLKCSF